MSEDIERRVRQLEGDVTDIKTNMATVTRDIKHIQEDTGAIKSDLRWMVRLVLGALLAAAVGFAMQGGFNVGK